MGSSRGLALFLLLVMVGFIFWVDYYYTSLPYYSSYISDEVWYVDSARNLLIKLGFQPRTPYPSATFFLYRWASLDSFELRASEQPGILVVKRLEKAWAVYVEASSWDVIRNLSTIPEVYEAKPGHVYGDAEGINLYYNMEHPPLGKYLIALSIALLGDSPLSWRIPSMISGGLLCILAGLLAREATRRDLYGALAALLVATDPLVRNMAGVAMLDIFLALFTAASAYCMLKGRLFTASAFIGLAASVKMSGAFLVIPMAFLALARLRSLVKIYMVTAIIPLLVFLAANIPMIALFGLQTWYDQSIAGAISWHLKTKTPEGQGPPSSAPWMWFYGESPFYLTVSPDTIATGNVAAYMGSVLLAMAAIPIHRFLPCQRLLMGTAAGVWTGYLGLWILGNHSQYSFYMVQIAPLLSSLFASLLYVFVEHFDLVAALYQKILESLGIGRGSRNREAP